MVQPVPEDERLRLAHVQHGGLGRVAGKPPEGLDATVPLDQHVAVGGSGDDQDGDLLSFSGERLLEAGPSYGSAIRRFA